MFKLVNKLQARYERKLHTANYTRAMDILQNHYELAAHPKRHYYPTPKDPSVNYQILSRAGLVTTIPNTSKIAAVSGDFDTSNVDELTDKGVKLIKPVEQHRNKIYWYAIELLICVIALAVATNMAQPVNLFAINTFSAAMFYLVIEFVAMIVGVFGSMYAIIRLMISSHKYGEARDSVYVKIFAADRSNR